MKKLLISLSMLLVFVACKKENKENPEGSNALEENSPYSYIYVLNQGAWGENNASLDRIALQTGEVENDIFAKTNSRNLGDVANDIILYGSKMYIVVNNSNTIEIINPQTAQSIQQISLANKQPRYIFPYNGFVYVSCYSDEIVEIDTTTYTITKTCNVGKDPEEFVITNNKLYVTNSGGLDYPNYDSTISIVGMSNFQEEKKLTVGLNPTKIADMGNGKLLVLCNGDYDTIPAFLAVVDINTEAITRLTYSCSNFMVFNNYVYCYDFDWNTYQAVFFKINVNSLEKESLILNGGGSIVSPYHIAINPSNGNIYISDSQNFRSNGDINCFTSTGTFNYKKECGIGTSKIVFW